MAEPDMAIPRRLPHGPMLLKGISVTSERLRSGSKVAISLSVLRAIIASAVAELPFDADFYLTHYPDIREAADAGRITDLHSHFVETGYFEGRLGSDPHFDEIFYRNTYPDVVEAIEAGTMASAFDHYICAGVFEGRHANARDMDITTSWRKIFQPSDMQQPLRRTSND